HLIFHVLAKPVLDQLSRRAAGTKSRNLSLRHQLAERLVEVSFHIFMWNLDDDVPLAGATRLDFHLQAEPLILASFRCRSFSCFGVGHASVSGGWCADSGRN